MGDNIIYWVMRLKHGVTGLLRIKNDGAFVERCIESCIGALDQIVVVYNDCTDHSAAEIRKMKGRYPDKIDIFEYKPKIYGTNLSREEYETAMCLPEDSPHLLCNYYNFALSKAKFEYALKIDADQIYFYDELKKWCDFCRVLPKVSFSFYVLMGLLFQKYLSFYRYASLKLGLLLPIMPKWLVVAFYPAYIKYAKYLFVRDKACLSMSGLNVMEEEERLVPLGCVAKEINVMPPFNGEGDHVIFKVSEATRYEKFQMPYYNTARSVSYSLIEEFKHPYRIMFLGFFWTHITLMRPDTLVKAQLIKQRSPKTFVSLEKFLELDFCSVLSMTDKRLFRLYQRILFSFVYTANKAQLRKAVYDSRQA